MNPGIVVFSGGSAANSLVDVFNTVRESKNCPLSYIIPISDNGGSSSELIRVFGGPGVGDVRSMSRYSEESGDAMLILSPGRLVRLIPNHPASAERTAIANLFTHRLSSVSPHAASEEWQSLVSGISPLWSKIPSAKKQLIRSFLNLLNLEILKRSRPPTSTFDFTSASVGNLFLTGARLFSGSFESAIYLLSSICGVPDDLVQVIPAINSNFTHHIAARLADGTVIVGQNSISHPSEPTALENHSPTTSKGHRSRHSLGDPEAVCTDDEQVEPDHEHEQHEDANLPGSLPTLRASSIKFSKSYNPTTTANNTTNPSTSTSTNLPPPTDDLPARIIRLWYINPYGQEIRPPPNPRVLSTIHSAQAIIYSIGSLYTSIIPSLILRGVGDAIRKAPAARTKILILNGSLDREVGPRDKPFTALDFVRAIVRAGEESRGHSHSADSEWDWEEFDVNATQGEKNELYTAYVTHLIYVSPPSSAANGTVTPLVDTPALRALGIESLKLYGRKVEERAPNGEMVTTGMRYDPAALRGAIETILGRKGAAMIANGNASVNGNLNAELDGLGMGMGFKSRRNTLDDMSARKGSSTIV